MSSNRRSEIVTGLFVTLAAVVFALFAFKVGRFDLMGLLKDDAMTCRTYFANVKTLQAGSKVRVGGREVGEVVDLVLVEAPTATAAPDAGGLERLVNEVTFELTYPQLRLDPDTARVRLAQESLLAPHFLELDPGRWPAASPPATLFEAELPAVVAIASEAGVGIEELMALAQPAIAELGTLIRTVNEQLLTEDNLGAVSRALGELDGVIAEGRQVAATLNRDLLTPENVAALERTIHNLDGAVAEGRSVAARLDALLEGEEDPRLDDLLAEVSAATGELRVNLNAVSADLRQLLQNTDRVVGHAETELEARDLDLTEIRLRGRARPYEQRDERDDRP